MAVTNGETTVEVQSTPALYEKQEALLPSNSNVAPTNNNSAGGFSGLKSRIKEHYDLLSEYYQSLWHVLTIMSTYFIYN